MPNGRPGDHPYTDIVVHEAEIYTEAVREFDSVAEEIDNTRRGRRKLSELLWDIGWEPAEDAAVESALRAFRERHWVWGK